MLEEQVNDAQTHSSPKLVFERMIQILNRHDLDAMVACFAPDFRSEQPLHPERDFTGQEGVRKNWSFFFKTVPDIQVDILNEVEEGDTVWAEVHYLGTQNDGKRFNVKGVTLLGIQADQITWARLYIEPVEEPH
jgi:predicted SnoaL-like aldol condensation-catalyzing enzyme